jgi:hypothetical protein
LTTDQEYSEILSQIKATDEISFKVLGFVPLSTGATVLGLLHSEKLLHGPVLFAVSTFAAIVILGFFRWELRNIQTCSWLYSRASAMDGQARPKSPGGVGKTEAECLIYSATIALWLVLPWLLATTDGLLRTDRLLLGLETAHGIVSVCVLALTIHGIIVIRTARQKSARKLDLT